MTITKADDHVGTDGTGSVTVTDTTDIANTSGNLQVAFLVHRTSTLTASITDTSGGGDGDWNGPYTAETEIGDSSWRRAIAWFWRTVPSDAGNFDVKWSSSANCVAMVYEFNSDTGGGSWQLDSSTSAGSFSTNSGQTTVATLECATVTPGAEGVVAAAIVARHGDPDDEDSWDESFITGVSNSIGGTAAGCGGFSAYRIVNSTAVNPAATWTTNAAVTSAIAAFSYASQGSSVPARATTNLMMLTR